MRQRLDGVDSIDEPGAINLLQLEVEFLHLEIAFTLNGGFARQVGHRPINAIRSQAGGRNEWAFVVGSVTVRRGTGRSHGHT